MKVYHSITKGLGLVGIVGVLIMSFCTKDNPVQPKIEDTWTITGNVQDGYTGAFLDSAQVVYSDRDGKQQIIFTSAGGSFACPNLPYGAVALTFQYNQGTTKYTTTVLNIASGPKQEALTKGKDSTEFKFRDTAVVVKLFAMSGSVSGTVKTRVHERAPLIDGANVPVKVTYGTLSDVAMEFASPRTFTAVAGADGSFRIDSLPLAPNATLTLLSATVGGVDFAQKAIPVPDLTQGGVIGVGTIIMDTPVSELQASSKFKLLYTNFPTKQILPNGTMVWTFSNTPDSVASYAVIQAVGASAASNNVTASVSGNAFTVTPNPALNNGQKYFVSVFVYGMAGGFVKDTSTVLVKSANTEQVIASNVLTATKDPISGLGINDSIYFTFAKNLKEASVSVMHGGIVDLVTNAISNDKIVVKSKGSWLAATTYNITVNGTLEDGTPVSFIASFSTEGSLMFVNSNVFNPLSPNTGKDGFIVSDSIVVTANKDLSAANAILKDSLNNQIPVIVKIKNGDTVVVTPEVVLNFATRYYLNFSITATTGEVLKAAPNFLTISSSFYMVSSNACIGGDASKPSTEVDPSVPITIIMSERVNSATASLKAGGPIATTTTAGTDEQGTTISIKPTNDPIPDNTLCTLSVTVSNMNDIRTVIVINGFKTRSELYTVWSNVRMGNDPGKPILNFDPLDNIIVKMSRNLVKATAQINSGTVLANISIMSDTIVINPEQALVAGTSYDVAISAEDEHGIKYSGTLVTGLIPVRGVFIVASNVLTSDFVSLTNVPINVVPWFKMSVAPVASSMKATLTGTISGTVGNEVTANGDTIVITPVTNFRFGETVTIAFEGMATNGKWISESESFSCEPEDVFVVASNLIDANGDPIMNFTRFGTMWIKFTEVLDTAKNNYAWTNYNAANAWVDNPLAAPADVQIVGEGTIAPPNATVRISGDTLLITPDNRAQIDFNQKVGFTVTIRTQNGKTATFAACVQTTPIYLYVKATNTKDADGAMRDDFGYQDVVWVVSSVTLDSIISVRDSQSIKPALAQIPDAASGLLRSRVRLAATGDTIFYTPSVPLNANSTYGMDFTVHIKSRAKGLNNANVLGMNWRTTTGVQITAMNLLTNATTYRVFKVIGDSVVATFSKPIDTAWNAAQPFTVVNVRSAAPLPVIIGSAKWSSDLRTVTFKNSDTLNARTYVTDAADYSTDLEGTRAPNYVIGFRLTCQDGEIADGVTGATVKGGYTNSFVPQLAVKTEYKLALIGSNMVDGHTTAAAIANTETHKDTFALAGNPTLVFNRAVDTNMIKANAASLYQNFIKLVTFGSTTPLEFALTFSNGGTTITMNPNSNFIAGTTYDVIITNIPAIGLKASDRFTGTGNASSILTAYDFKALPAPAIDISGLRDSIAKDTMAAALAFEGNKVGYSPVNVGGVQADGSFKIRVQKTAWNANYYDSITDYEVLVRNITTNQARILTTTINRGSDFDPFASDNMTARMWINQTVNVASEASIYNSLTVQDADGASANYSNGAKMLNDSTIIEIQVRPRKDNGGGNISYGVWSNAIRFADNVAPGDSDYVANVVLTPNLGVATFNRSGIAGDSSNYVDVGFPEDMDTSTVPAITFYDGASTGSTAPAAAATSRWTNGRNYRIYIKLAGNVNYVSNGWYYNVSVAGMKDYSGVVLQTTGTLPDPVAANGTTYAAMGGTTLPTQGNQTAGVGTGKAGYYQFP